MAMNEKKPRIIILIQARLGSTRLPGKPLKEVLGKPLLHYLVERLKRVKLADMLVLAMTDKIQDDALVTFSNSIDLPFFRGSEDNVLERFFLAAQQFKADIIVRITSDCPLIDPELIDLSLSHFLEKYPHIDYQSNALKRTYPRGMEVEVFTFKSFEKVALEAKKNEEKEHVTPYYYRHPETFNIENIEGNGINSHLRLTVDTIDDFELVRKIIEALYPQKNEFTLSDIVDLLKQNPEWQKINAHVKQKSLDNEK
jgi:spore coat polysaccharide biosynthesis protein SpsF